MTTPTIGRTVVWTTVALSVVMLIAGAAFATVDLQGAVPQFFAFRGFEIPLGFCYLTVALLILHRQPTNAIGILFLIVGFTSALYWLATQYGLAAVLGDTNFRGGEYAAWFQSWGWAFFVVPLLSFLPSLYPSGRFTYRWDRSFFIVGILAIIAIWLGTSTGSGPLNDEAAYALNPLALNFLPQAALEPLVFLFLVGIAIGSIVSISQSYRNGNAVERLQLKWLMTAVTFLGLAFVIAVTASVVAPTGFETYQVAFEVLIVIGMLLIPAAVGFAITRYRLYDIEVVINRAIVYGPLTATVAASYVVAVQLARLSFVAVTGESSDSELLVATLIAAAIFWMVRTRMIKSVDSHFKDPREPAKDLRTLRASIKQMSQIIDPSAISAHRLADHVLTASIAAFDATGGTITYRPEFGPGSPVTKGEPIADSPIAIDLAHNGIAIGALHLGPRASYRPYTPRDTDALVETAQTLAEILSRRATAPKR